MLSNIKDLVPSIFFRKDKFFPYLFIMFLTWMSRFLLSSSFGLYEDDWNFSGNAITNTFAQNIDRISSALFTFWQGRPVHMTFLTFIPFWGSKLGGLNTLYFIGFLILSTNACLFYSLLKAVTKQPYIPIIAALFFCLYPADTTFNFLQHLFGLQTSLLFLLLAFHFYIFSEEFCKSKYLFRTFSYLCTIFSLLTYESLFLIFFTAPFFSKSNTKKQIINHFLILISILIIYLTLRKLSGEQRVIELGIISTIKFLIYQVFAGPIISTGTFFVRPFQILTQFNSSNLFILLIAVPIFYCFINYFINSRMKSNQNNSKEEFKEILKWLVIGVIITILAYPSALILSVNIIDGRASRVHFAAALGTSIILSCLWSWLIIKNNQQKLLNRLTILLLSLHLSFLFIFCINVQIFYKLSWEYQQAFWSDVIKLSPDLNKGTVILVQAPNLGWGKQINPFDWSMPSVLSSIYKFPQKWKFKPMLYVLNSTSDAPDNWKNKMIKDQKFILSKDSQALKFYYPWEPERKLDSKDIILLVEENNQLVRKQVLNLSNQTVIPLKHYNSRTMIKHKFDTSILFDRLIKNKDNNNINSNYPAIYFESQH